METSGSWDSCAPCCTTMPQKNIWEHGRAHKHRLWMQPRSVLLFSCWTTVDRSGLRKSPMCSVVMWAAIHHRALLSSFLPTRAWPWGTFWNFPSLWDKSRLTLNKKRKLLISGWSWILYEIPKGFLKCCYFPKKATFYYEYYPENKESRNSVPTCDLPTASNNFQSYK